MKENTKCIRNLDCAGGGCCPDAIVHDDGRVTISEGGFHLTLQPGSAKELRKLLEEYGY